MTSPGPTSPLWLALFVLVLLLIEARRAASHEQRQRARGGVEPPGDVYRWMQVCYPGAFVAMLLEGWSAGPPSRLLWISGLALLLAGKALKWWAIVTLGEAWTFRVIVVPGATRVAAGPYRWLSHPNYVGVVGELVGVACMTGARVTGPVAIVLFGILLQRRLSVESRALDAILRRS